MKKLLLLLLCGFKLNHSSEHQSIQKLIDSNSHQIKEFIGCLTTDQDLVKPLPLPGCSAPAIFDLVLHKRNINSIEAILTKGFCLDNLQWKGHSLFHFLTRMQKSKMLQKVVSLCKSHKISILNLINKKMKGNPLSALMIAATTCDLLSAKVLIENGADVHAVADKKGLTALYYATGGYEKEKVVKMVSLLCQAGANPDLHAPSCKALEIIHYVFCAPKTTPLFWARFYGHADAVRIMQAYSLHNKKSCYFSALPIALVIYCLQNYKPSIIQPQL